MSLRPITDADITAADIYWELQPGPWPTSTPADVDLLTRVVDLTIERDTYRTLAHQTIYALADLQQRYDHQRAQYLRLLDECRKLRTTRRAA